MPHLDNNRRPSQPRDVEGSRQRQSSSRPRARDSRSSNDKNASSQKRDQQRQSVEHSRGISSDARRRSSRRQSSTSIQRKRNSDTTSGQAMSRSHSQSRRSRSPPTATRSRSLVRPATPSQSTKGESRSRPSSLSRSNSQAQGRSIGYKPARASQIRREGEKKSSRIVSRPKTPQDWQSYTNETNQDFCQSDSRPSYSNSNSANVDRRGRSRFNHESMIVPASSRTRPPTETVQRRRSSQTPHSTRRRSCSIVDRLLAPAEVPATNDNNNNNNVDRLLSQISDLKERSKSRDRGDQKITKINGNSMSATSTLSTKSSSEGSKSSSLSSISTQKHFITPPPAPLRPPPPSLAVHQHRESYSRRSSTGMKNIKHSSNKPVEIFWSQDAEGLHNSSRAKKTSTSFNSTCAVSPAGAVVSFKKEECSEKNTAAASTACPTGAVATFKNKGAGSNTSHERKMIASETAPSSIIMKKSKGQERRCSTPSPAHTAAIVRSKSQEGAVSPSTDVLVIIKEREADISPLKINRNITAAPTTSSAVIMRSNVQGGKISPPGSKRAISRSNSQDEAESSSPGPRSLPPPPIYAKRHSTNDISMSINSLPLHRLPPPPKRPHSVNDIPLPINSLPSRKSPPPPPPRRLSSTPTTLNTPSLPLYGNHATDNTAYNNNTSPPIDAINAIVRRALLNASGIPLNTITEVASCNYGNVTDANYNNGNAMPIYNGPINPPPQQNAIIPFTEITTTNNDDNSNPIAGGKKDINKPRKTHAVSKMSYTDHHGDTGIYTGEVDDESRPHGKGKMRYDNGIFYEGNWIQGKQDHAQGTSDEMANVTRERIMSGFTSWKGQRSQKNLKEGIGDQGTYVYGMEWVDRTGMAGKYTGHVDANDDPDGKGVMRYEFGLVAEGDWIKGVINDRQGMGAMGAASVAAGGGMTVAGGGAMSVAPGMSVAGGGQTVVSGLGMMSICGGGGAGMMRCGSPWVGNGVMGMMNPYMGGMNAMPAMPATPSVAPMSYYPVAGAGMMTGASVAPSQYGTMNHPQATGVAGGVNSVPTNINK